MNGNKWETNVCSYFLLTKPNISSIIPSVKKIAEIKDPPSNGVGAPSGRSSYIYTNSMSRTDKNLKHSEKTMLDGIITYLRYISQVISSISAK